MLVDPAQERLLLRITDRARLQRGAAVAVAGEDASGLTAPPPASLPLDDNFGPARDHGADDIDRARRADLVAAAHGRRSPATSALPAGRSAAASFDPAPRPPPRPASLGAGRGRRAPGRGVAWSSAPAATAGGVVGRGATGGVAAAPGPPRFARSGLCLERVPHVKATRKPERCVRPVPAADAGRRTVQRLGLELHAVLEVLERLQG